MSPEDLDHIEARLAVKLPFADRERVAPLAIATLAGNKTADLWDDAGALIERNLEMRQGLFASPWTAHVLLVRDSLTQRPFALDLEALEPMLVVVENYRVSVEAPAAVSVWRTRAR